MNNLERGTEQETAFLVLKVNTVPVQSVRCVFMHWRITVTYCWSNYVLLELPTSPLYLTLTLKQFQSNMEKEDPKQNTKRYIIFNIKLYSRTK